MLRKIRIAVSVILFSLITLYFIDFAGILPHSFSFLAEIQFLPALLALNFVVLGALVVLTLIFGRVYCSSICPLGVFQDITYRLRRTLTKKKKFKYKKITGVFAPVIFFTYYTFRFFFYHHLTKVRLQDH